MAAHHELLAVYSIGCANAGINEAFEAVGRKPEVFIGHDLVPDNVTLLREGRMSAVLHHDLKQDIQRCCRVIMHAHGALANGDTGEPSKIDVITPFNIPHGF